MSDRSRLRGRETALLTLLLLAAASGCAPGSGVEGEWPQWRGPDRTGVSTETGLRSEWPNSDLPLLWTAENLGRGYSSVAISDGIVYTMGERDEAEWTVALDARDGSELWARRTGDRFHNRRGDGPRGTPTVAGKRVYTYGPNGDLWSLDRKTGEPDWHVNVLEKFGTEGPHWGLAESPLVDGDLLMLATGSPDGSIVAFDRHTGDVVWQSAGLTDEPGYASAIVADVGGVRQAIYFTDVAVNGIRLSDGLPMWRYERVANSHANCATPVYHEGHVFVTSAYDTGAALLRLESADGTTTAHEVYFTRNMMNHHGGVVILDDHVYGFSNRILTCIDLWTGELEWRDRSLGKGSLTAADGMLYLQTEHGSLALIRATPERYEEVSRAFVMTANKAWSYPVVAGGRLYVRIHDELRCYDVKA